MSTDANDLAAYFEQVRKDGQWVGGPVGSIRSGKHVPALLGALEAVLKLADDWDERAGAAHALWVDECAQELRAAVSSALSLPEPPESDDCRVHHYGDGPDGTGTIRHEGRRRDCALGASCGPDSDEDAPGHGYHDAGDYPS